jgi:hypothetical protein
MKNLHLLFIVFVLYAFALPAQEIVSPNKNIKVVVAEKKQLMKKLPVKYFLR